MDYFSEQQRKAKLRREQLPLDNRRYVIIYERTDHEIEVVAVNQESMAHAIFEAMLDVVDLQQANRMDHTGKNFWFSLNLYRCPNPTTVSKQNPNRWTIQMAGLGSRIVPVSVRPTSGQFPLRGQDLDTYRGTD